MPKKILAIDDDENQLLLLRDLVEGLGHEFLRAQRGDDGVRLARESKPDIVLLDLMMPGMHGFDVCSTLRRDPSLAAAKIIVLSAKGYPFDVSNAKAAGADDYLVKPFPIARLIELLR